MESNGAMTQITQPDSCKGCALYGVSKGFVLDVGDPEKAKYLMCFEAPGKQEIEFQLRPLAGRGFFETQTECDAELGRRRAAFPSLPEQFIRTGVPVVGPTGQAIQWMVWQKVGIQRGETFIMNTLRCLPPKNKQGTNYPTGKVRAEAERCCRQYDRIEKFGPTTLVTTIHPASILREITPLPLVVKDLEKVRDFTGQGRRVMVLLGGKASEAFLRYASNVTRWRGHYENVGEGWGKRYREMFEKVKKKIGKNK